MKKKMRSLLALLLCLCLALGMLAGCGGEKDTDKEKESETTEAPKEDPKPDADDDTNGEIPELAETTWIVEGVYYTFYDDGSMLADNGDTVATGTYSWHTDLGVGTLTLEGATVGLLFSEGVLLMEGEDGLYYTMEQDFSGGSLEPTLGGAEDQIFGLWVLASDGNTFLCFDGIDTVEVGELDSEESEFYPYSYDGQSLIIYDTYSESVLGGYLDADGDLIIDEVGSYFEHISEDDTYPEGNWQLYEHSDGTLTFEDYDRGVCYTCPDWMTVILDGIGENVDATVVGDNAGGYVIVDNVTDEWYGYLGEDITFLEEYADAYMDELFVPVYGMWADSTGTDVEPEEEDQLAILDLNLWNSQWDIRVLMVLREADDGSILVQCYMAPYSNEEQMLTLWDEVVDIAGMG